MEQEKPKNPEEFSFVFPWHHFFQVHMRQKFEKFEKSKSAKFTCVYCALHGIFVELQHIQTYWLRISWIFITEKGLFSQFWQQLSVSHKNKRYKNAKLDQTLKRMRQLRPLKIVKIALKRTKSNFYIPWKGYSNKINENQAPQKIWFLTSRPGV